MSVPKTTDITTHLRGWIDDSLPPPPGRLKDHLRDALAEIERLRGQARDAIAVPRKLLGEAHAAMRACGWQLAPASDDGSDGVLNLAVAEIEEAFGSLLREPSPDACPRGCPDGECYTLGECEAP